MVKRMNCGLTETVIEGNSNEGVVPRGMFSSAYSANPFLESSSFVPHARPSEMTSVKLLTRSAAAITDGFEFIFEDR